jgi:uncharacterized protein Yka (UPF0111/DUF47 family)
LKEIGKVEERFVKRVEGISSEVDRLERRIDSLMDQGSQARKNNKFENEQQVSG